MNVKIWYHQQDNEKVEKEWDSLYKGKYVCLFK